MLVAASCRFGANGQLLKALAQSQAVCLIFNIGRLLISRTDKGPIGHILSESNHSKWAVKRFLMLDTYACRLDAVRKPKRSFQFDQGQIVIESRKRFIKFWMLDYLFNFHVLISVIEINQICTRKLNHIAAWRPKENSCRC